MININDLKIDTGCFGKKILADVRPYFSYSGSNKDLDGYRYKIVLPAFKMESLEIKIPGAKQLDLKEGAFPYVEFNGLEVKVYVIEGKPVLAATAKGIHEVNEKA